MTPLTGDGLYRLVETYHGLGNHRAGTAVDHATIDWYRAELEARGFSTEYEVEPFGRYVTSSSLTADGVPVDHVPLFYEWTGTIETGAVHVTLANAKSGGRDGDLDHAIEAGKAAGAEALVVATDHPEGSLVAVNREPIDHNGFPTVLVAARDHDRLADARSIELQFTASIEPSETTNLIARNGNRAGDGDALLLTTPLTGWFGCAGERGTAAAVLLALSAKFIDRPLVILATGGHELDYLGVRRWVGADPVRPKAIAHLGASLAVDAPNDVGQRELVAARLAMTDRSGTEAERIGEALAPANFIYRPEAAGWLGESEVFCDLGVPMISFTGSGIDFHTPEDTPERSTSPAALETVTKAVGDAIEALLDSL